MDFSALVKLSDLEEIDASNVEFGLQPDTGRILPEPGPNPSYIASLGSLTQLRTLNLRGDHLRSCRGSQPWRIWNRSTYATTTSRMSRRSVRFCTSPIWICGGNASLVDVSALAMLSDLQSLDLSDTKVADMAPLTVLKNLKHLDLSSVRLDCTTQADSLAKLSAQGTAVISICP